MHGFHREQKILWPLLLLLLFLAACNLTSAPEQLELTNVPTSTILPTRTVISTGSAPTPITVTSLPLPPTSIAQRPTAILPPTFVPFPTASPLPINIAILSPIPGSTVAGNVQVIGAATHPSFLQYQLEWGPDPNPGDLWFLAGGIVQNPVFNGLLGIWNTTSIQDGQYQLRLKVFLRDGTNLATVVNGIRVQNSVPTAAPTSTTVPRPIAAFSVDRASGQAPLVVRFFNQSSGNITSYSWDFGDGGSSSEASPVHTFRNPGVYTVTFRVRGPGGGSNVSRQISVQGTTPPVAGFTQDRTSGPAPLTVQFTDQSQGNITQRLWAFGDGTTSDTTNPSHQFTAVGTYNVILTVTGPGGSSSVTRQITVENPTIPEPIAALVPSQTEGEAPLTVQFDASDSSGQITSYNWIFGDGSFGNGQIVTHTYPNAGLYEVILVVVGPGGQSERRVEINVIQPPDAPVAAIIADPTSGDAPLTVNFDASDSTGPIDSYRWDFGDDLTGEGESVQHVFTTAGTYTVELTVQGPGGSDTETIEISALEPVQPPTAAFNSLPTEGTAPLEVQFTNQSEGEELTFEWSFGDGSPVSNERDPRHTFNNPGDYTVTLRVTGPGGADEAQATIRATEPSAPPSAAFDALPTSGEAPLTVTFDSTGDPDSIASYFWEFGDGETSDQADPQHVYQQQGNYTARLTVTGADGRESSSETQIAVSEAVVIAPPVAAFSADPLSGIVGQPVQFTNATTGDVTSYEWNFGDGSPTVSDANPQHTFTAAGDFTITLRAIGPGGENIAQQTYSVAQPAQPPVAAFSADPPSGTVGQPVQFTNATTGDVTSYEWNFGDGSPTVSDANPQHTFNAVGDFTVTLRAIGPGGENIAQQTYSVAQPAQPPVAAFSADPPSGTVGQPVQFTNATTGDVTSYEWNFGDGSPAVSDANPQHTFNAAGDFTVTLRAIGPGGENIAQQTYSVAQPAQPPVAAFSADPPSGTVGQPVQFTNATTGDVTSYEWNFGDGSPAVSDANPQHTFTAAGDFTVTLRALGPGGENTAQQTYSVAQPAQPPVAGFSADPPSGTVGQPVQFTNATTGDVTSYEWNFGDGSPVVSDANPQHTFTAAGDFTVTLRAIGPGGENTAQQTYSVAQPAQPPVAAFSAEPTSGTVGQPVQFTNTTTGDVTSYEWNFGDGSPAVSDANPQYTFTAAGDFTVTLRAIGPGGENIAQQTYSVAQPAQPPVAAFSAEPTSGTVGQPVQFTNATTGDVTSYEWNFGDGSPAVSDANPQHTFTAAGDFTVTLRAIGPGGENTAQQTYSVADAASKEPSILDEIPILPDLDAQGVRNRLRAIFDNGVAQGRRAGVFAVIGDDMAVQQGYLDPFADTSLNIGDPDFQPIVDWYNQVDLGNGQTSFNRGSLAASAGWRSGALLDASSRRCDTDETPLECELRLTQASVVIISLGMNDVGVNDPELFRDRMEQILHITIGKGVIPIVTTIQPNPNNADQVRAMNEAIIEAVRNVEASNDTYIPIYNLWRAYSELPNNGLEGDNVTPTTAPNGPGVISTDVTGTYATNRRNRQILNLLNRLHTQIFPDAAP